MIKWVDQVVDQNPKYVFTKRGVYYFTRRVPKNLQPSFNKTRVVVCLRTRSPAKARKAADQLAALLDSVWNQAHVERLGLRVLPVELSTPKVEHVRQEAQAEIRLSDAYDIYVRLKGRGKGKAFRAYTDRNLGYALDCLGNASLAAIGRVDAGHFRDFLIEKRLTTSSIKRVFATVRAAVNLAISEHGLDCTNPFSGTFIPQIGEKKVRPPVPNDHILSIQRACMSVDDDRRWLIALISDTGLRLAEAAGLVRSDLKLDHDIPYVQVKAHPWRTLKTPASARAVPLVGASLWAARRALDAAPGDFIFPSYSSRLGTNANSASAALNQWLRARLPKGCVIHSFRHSMRDRLRAVECPADIVDAIGGWITQGVGHGYGAGYPLDVKQRWLAKVVLIQTQGFDHASSETLAHQRVEDDLRRLVAHPTSISGRGS